MKLKNILLSIFIITVSCNVVAGEKSLLPETISGSETVQDDYINHTVVSGETVFSLARTYQTTVEEIYRLNPDAQNGIKAGQILRIPKVQTHTAPSTSSSSYFEHIVQKGETIYRISRNYEVSVETLYSLNPALSKDGLKEGMVLRIPRLKIAPSNSAPELRQQVYPVQTSGLYTEHRVASGETLYGLSKKYDVLIEDIFKENPALQDGLKTGMLIRIPKSTQGAVTLSPDTRLYGAPLKTGETIRIALLFPFTEGAASVQKEKLVEYYEGFLLAVRELKAAGLNAQIYTFDTGSENNTQRLRSILETNEMQNLHLVIGGVSQTQIDMLSDFSRRTGTRYVVPFGVSKDKDVVTGSPNIYQMTVSHKTLFPEITKAFVEKFRNDNIIFITESGSDTNKKDFVDVLKAMLAAEGINYKEIHAKDNMVEEIKRETVLDRNNVLIPTSSSELTLRRMSGILATFTHHPETKSNKEPEPQPQITLFGYPEWQTYASLKGQLYKFNTHIYTGFYLDENDRKVQNTMYEYKKWFNKEVPYYFPKFCFLGYDTGIYFLSGLQKYNNTFESYLSFYSAPTLQSAIRMESTYENSGYINGGFYFVRYITDTSVEKTELK